MFDMNDDNYRCDYIFQDGEYQLSKEKWPTKFVTRPMIGETIISKDNIYSKIIEIRHIMFPRPLMEIVLGQPYLT